MRIFTKLVIVLLCLVSTKGIAAYPQRMFGLCGEFEVEVNALYWKMMQCYTVYGHQQTVPKPNFFLQDVLSSSLILIWGKGKDRLSQWMLCC